MCAGPDFSGCRHAWVMFLRTVWHHIEDGQTWATNWCTTRHDRRGSQPARAEPEHGSKLGKAGAKTTRVAALTWVRSKGRTYCAFAHGLCPGQDWERTYPTPRDSHRTGVESWVARLEPVRSVRAPPRSGHAQTRNDKQGGEQTLKIADLISLVVSTGTRR